MRAFSHSLGHFMPRTIVYRTDVYSRVQRLLARKWVADLLVVVSTLVLLCLILFSLLNTVNNGKFNIPFSYSSAYQAMESGMMAAPSPY